MRKLIYVCCFFAFFSCKNASENDTSEVTEVAQQEHPPEVKESISRGAAIYNNFCASCHLGSGDGIAGTFPPVNNSDWLTKKRAASIKAVKFGLHGPIEVNGVEYDNLMPDLGLTDQEIADVMNYIMASWDNKLKEPVSVEEVAALEE